MQLYAVLESVQKYFINLNKISVLYRADAEYTTAYDEVKADFPQVSFVKQGSNPRNDFKPLMLSCIFDSPAKYILFAVDDVIVKDYVDAAECVKALKDTKSYAFYLRLGTNVTTQYGQNITAIVPGYESVNNDIIKFQFKKGKGDWAYPHSVDMTFFKKSKIAAFLKRGIYSSPNTFESQWSGTADLNQYGLCFKTSKIFTLPMNIVQQDFNAVCENVFTAEELLRKWQGSYKIDINQFYKIHNNCTFMGYKPQFISR